MKTIEVIVHTDGTLKIDAIGFAGPDCEKATQFLEQALGRTTGKQKKPEYHRQVKRQQQVGRMNVAIIFTPDGTGHALYTEAIDMAVIGALSIQRATTIEFDNNAECWRVRDPDGFHMFDSPSRQACLDWERQYLESEEDRKHELLYMKR